MAASGQKIRRGAGWGVPERVARVWKWACSSSGEYFSSWPILGWTTRILGAPEGVGGAGERLPHRARATRGAVRAAAGRNWRRRVRRMAPDRAEEHTAELK